MAVIKWKTITWADKTFFGPWDTLSWHFSKLKYHAMGRGAQRKKGGLLQGRIHQEYQASEKQISHRSVPSFQAKSRRFRLRGAFKIIQELKNYTYINHRRALAEHRTSILLRNITSHYLIQPFIHLSLDIMIVDRGRSFQAQTLKNTTDSSRQTSKANSYSQLEWVKPVG